MRRRLWDWRSHGPKPRASHFEDCWMTVSYVPVCGETITVTKKFINLGSLVHNNGGSQYGYSRLGWPSFLWIHSAWVYGVASINGEWEMFESGSCFYILSYCIAVWHECWIVTWIGMSSQGHRVLLTSAAWTCDTLPGRWFFSQGCFCPRQPTVKETKETLK